MKDRTQKLDAILEEHFAGNSRLKVKTFVTTRDDDVPAQTFVLLQGDRASLQFLADTITAHLKTDIRNFFIHPAGPGSAHFSSDSNAGIYIHRLPCTEDPPMVM